MKFFVDDLGLSLFNSKLFQLGVVLGLYSCCIRWLTLCLFIKMIGKNFELHHWILYSYWTWRPRLSRSTLFISQIGNFLQMFIVRMACKGFLRGYCLASGSWHNVSCSTRNGRLIVHLSIEHRQAIIFKRLSIMKLALLYEYRVLMAASIDFLEQFLSLRQLLRMHIS